MFRLRHWTLPTPTERFGATKTADRNRPGHYLPPQPTVAKQHSCAPQLEFLLTGEVHTLDTLDAIDIFDRLAWQVDASG